MIRESEDDDITGVLEFLIKMYSTEIGDVAWELCVHLVRRGERWLVQLLDPTLSS